VHALLKTVWHLLSANKDPLTVILASWGAVLSTYGVIRQLRKEGDTAKEIRFVSAEANCRGRRTEMTIKLANPTKNPVRLTSLRYRVAGEARDHFTIGTGASPFPVVVLPKGTVTLKLDPDKDKEFTVLYATDDEKRHWKMKDKAMLRKLNSERLEAEAKRRNNIDEETDRALSSD